MVAQTRNYVNFYDSLPRMQARDEGCVSKWRYKVEMYSPDEVRKYCVLDANWQEFRLSLKGLSTYVKLANLELWRSKHIDSTVLRYNTRFEKVAHDEIPRRVQVQLDNYINALKRGGQLDLNCNVRR